MAILTLNNLGQAFGGFDVFTGLYGSVEPGAKIGMVGPNGIGKTTLLLILAGLAEPSHGGFTLSQGVRMGYLRQEAMQAFNELDNTVFEEMMGVFDEVRAMEVRMRELEDCMATGDTTDALLEEYGEMQHQFELRDGYIYEVSIKQTLEGLGFKPQHWELPLRHLSGGQKTRALLARLLLEKPDLLILDEPTNHLDVEALEWLETRLRAWDGALLIVSHDRYFLDKTVNTIWEMSRTGIESYRGNYSAYLKQREERYERSAALYQQEKERLEKELDYVKRNIVRASTNAMAVGRLRRLSRDLIAIRSVGIVAFRESKSWSQLAEQLDVGHARPMGVMEAEQELKALQPPNSRPPKLNFNLKTTLRSGDLVMRGRDLRIGYPDAPLFTSDDIVLERGERVALIGGNGTGKTTFLRTITQQIKPLVGEIDLGASLKVGYFAQAHEDLLPENTVMDELIRHQHMNISQARQILGQYLFRQEDVFKKVGDLSGGERGKLAMAILGTHGANFLLLDEPTNHLDIQAQEILQEVLEKFPGTVLLVTHDRYLVDKLATQIWNLENGHLQIFQGNYEEFLAARDKQTMTEQKAAAVAKKEAKAAAAATSVPKGQKNQKNKGVATLEQQISEMEAVLERLNQDLQNAQKSDEIWKLSEQFATSQSKLDALVAEWSAMAEMG